jgi:uncharacterized protein YcbX
MRGEELEACPVTPGGLLGDRTHALVDSMTGMVASAKNPKRWPGLLSCAATHVEPPVPGGRPPAVRITLPDGEVVVSDEPGAAPLLSRWLGREVAIASRAPAFPRLEERWPDLAGLPVRDAVTVEAMPPGTFFDVATIHLLTTSTMAALREQHPGGAIDQRRFRPNLVVETNQPPGFVEQAWLGREVRVGERLRLLVESPCPRCVMTTLEQEGLPRAPDVLRAIVRSAGGDAGVYARVIQGGVVRRGDTLTVTP